MFNQLVVIAVLGLWLNQVSSNPCEEFIREGFFLCQSEKTVTIFGQDHTCPDGTLCNQNYLAIQAQCSPCIESRLVCGDRYSCVNDKTFQMGLTEFQCPGKSKCNRVPWNSCQPCVEEKCDDDLWTCSDDDETIVSIPGLGEVPCPDHKICNKDKTPPCDYCIEKPPRMLPVAFQLGNAQ